MRRLLTTRITIFMVLIVINAFVIFLSDRFFADVAFYQITWLLRIFELLRFPVFSGNELLKLPNGFGIILIFISSAITIYIYYLVAGFFAWRLNRKDKLL